jgi:hypothetical protein
LFFEQLKPIKTAKHNNEIHEIFRAEGNRMASQLNFQPRPATKPQGSPYCADPNCESCRDLREMQERIRSENGAPQAAAKTVGSGIASPITGNGFSGNGANYRPEIKSWQKLSSVKLATRCNHVLVLFPMQEPITELVAKLRQEIAEITEANRRHLLGGRRLAESQSAHQRRAERLQEILNKLSSLTDWKKEWC